MAPKYTLVYFNAKARAEICRLLFAQAGIEYEDKRITQDEWKEMKPKTPFGGVPVICVDGKMYGQSMAIARYVALECGLAGKDTLEQLAADQVVEALKDIFAGAVKVRFEKDDEKKAQFAKEFKTETLPGVLSKLDALLGDRQWFTGNLTWADIAFYDTMERVKKIVGEASPCSNNSKLHALCERVAKLPKIAKWLETRPVTDI